MNSNNKPTPAIQLFKYMDSDSFFPIKFREDLLNLKTCIIVQSITIQCLISEQIFRDRMLYYFQNVHSSISAIELNLIKLLNR